MAGPEAAALDRIEVRWADGEQTRIEAGADLTIGTDVAYTIERTGKGRA